MPEKNDVVKDEVRTTPGETSDKTETGLNDLRFHIQTHMQSVFGIDGTLVDFSNPPHTWHRTWITPANPR